MAMAHYYKANILWTGNKGTGTSHYKEYERDFTIRIAGKPDLLGSSDANFRGDAERHNPEDLLLTAISSCHMLWYLHCCAVNQIRVLNYEDNCHGTMAMENNGAGQFEKVKLHPVITVPKGTDVSLAAEQHHRAHEMCFIARSVNFPVVIEAEFKEE